MNALDVAAPMGIIITAAIFREGYASLQLQAVLTDLPRALASLVRAGLKPTEMKDPPSWPVGGYVTTALFLLAVNLGLFIYGVRLGEDEAISGTTLVLGAFLVTHLIIAATSLRTVARGRRAIRDVKESSAAEAFFVGLSMDAGKKGEAGRINQNFHRVHQFKVALERVPQGVPDWTYREYLTEARVDLATALIEERRPLAALRQLELAAVEEGRWPGFLETYGADGRTVDLQADWSESKLPVLSARAHRLTGDVDAELDAWLTALRTAPSEFHYVKEVAEAADRAERIEDLRKALDALVSGDEPPDWAQQLYDRVSYGLRSSTAT
jgi:hypothetical protein